MSWMAAIFLLLALGFFVSALRALGQRRVLKLMGLSTLALLLLSVAALLATLALALQGYQALTREEVAAVVEVEPTAPQRFRVRFHLADGRQAEFQLAGDEFYVDAHILKWKSLANIFGLHTTYELDRVAGRYRQLSDEREAQRTVYALAAGKPVDLFELRQRYTMLAPLVDAEYGSATFVPVNGRQELEVRVSTSGLLIRPRQAR